MPPVNSTAAPNRDSSAQRQEYLQGGGRPQHTLSVVQNNADTYQPPAGPGCFRQALNATGRVLHTKTAAALTTAGVTAGSVYGLVKLVQHEIATAKVSSDPNYWIAKANITYQNCYNGCTNECDDTSFAFNNCATTAKVKINDTICDGNAMWNWLEKYPLPCLQSLGQTIQAQALAAQKQKDRDQLSIVIPIVLVAIAAGVVVYKAPKWFGCLTPRNNNNDNNRQGRV